MVQGDDGSPRRKELRRVEELIAARVSAATKEGRHWGRDGAIALCRRRLGALERLGEGARGYSAFASTYYAAAHYAASRIRLHPSAPFWGVRFFWDLARARCWIERHEKAVGGFEKMSAGALDIYAAIKTMTGDCRRYVSRDWADVCYLEAIRVAVEAGGRDDLSDDDQALNLIRRAGLRMRTRTGNGRWTESALNLITEAYSMVPRLTPLTAVRVIRNYGEYFEKIGNLSEAKVHLTAASVLAEQHGLTDQVAKIRPLLARVWEKRLGRVSYF